MDDNKKVNWNAVIDVVQNVMVFIVIVLTAVCITALIFADVIIGQGTMKYLTNGNDLAGWGISLATTGVLLVLMLLLYFAWKGRWGAGALIMLGVPVLAVYCADVYFDAALADILRYNGFVSLKTLPPGSLHGLFRMLLGAISTLGDGMGMALLVGMPVLKEIIGHSGVAKATDHHEPPHTSTWHPLPANMRIGRYLRPISELPGWSLVAGEDGHRYKAQDSDPRVQNARRMVRPTVTVGSRH